MQVIAPYYEIVAGPLNGETALASVELMGRTAYKSEALITPDSSKTFVRSLLARGHESVIEHLTLSIRFVCDRGVTHELVRHRLVSYTQESTRFCNYAKKGLVFIKPLFWSVGSVEYALWLSHMELCESIYLALIDRGCLPEQARAVLPNSLKTEISCTANFREWRHILRLRTAKEAHPQMRELMIPLLKELKRLYPILFDDISS